MAVRKIPYYTTPALDVEDTGSEDGILDVQPTGIITVTLGSDLVMWAERRVRSVDLAFQGWWRVCACDSDANHMAVLAVVNGDDVEDLRLAMQIAERTAVRLFPNHLLTEV
jgi:hypothetical protein